MKVILKSHSFSQISYLGAQPKPSQTSKLKSFVTIVNNQTLLSDVAMLFALDACAGPGYVYVLFK